jgi:hypothetical protein
MTPKRYLRHLERPATGEGFAIRAFDFLNQPEYTPENEWLMQDIEWPEWIDEAHNTYSGRVFIFGTGPSLVEQQPLLGRLQNEWTWTVNRMRTWWAKGQLPFIPSHHLVTEPGPCSVMWGSRMLSAYDFPEARNRIAINWWPVTAEGWLWCPKAPDDVHMRWVGFHGLDDTLPPLPTGWASPLTAAQLACWMGHTEIYFLGIDTTQEGQAWDPIAGRTLYERNIRSICESFERARMDIERAGRKVYDATPNGRINQEGILEYRDLAEILAN